MDKSICSFGECKRVIRYGGLCGGHAKQKSRGESLRPLRLSSKTSTQNEIFFSHISKGESCWEWTGHKDDCGYGRFNAKSGKTMAHRYSYEAHVGPIPAGLVIDHVCYNRACVNPAHLQAVSVKQNGENRSGANRDNLSSGIRGVTWHKKSRKWAVQVRSNGVSFHGGYFSDLVEAEMAAIELRNSIYTNNLLDRKYPSNLPVLSG